MNGVRGIRFGRNSMFQHSREEPGATQHKSGTDAFGKRRLVKT
jgi:hypothetical protein